MTAVALVLLSGWLAQAEPAKLPPGHPKFGSGEAPASSNGAPPSYQEVMRQLDSSPDLAKREKKFEIASAIGKLYALNGRYPEAVGYLNESVAKGAAARDVYRRNRKIASPQIPEGCQVSSESDFETVAAQSVEREKKGQRAEAGACAREVMTLLLSTEGWLGNALFLKGDAKGAQAVYTRILDTDPEDAGARYARGGLALDQGDTHRAADDLKLFLAKNPESIHAPSARALLARAEGKPIPVESFHGSRMPPMAGGPMAGGPMAGGPMAGGPMAGGPMAGGPMAGGPMAGGPMAGGPMAGGPMAGGPMAGGPMTGGPMAPGSAPPPLSAQTVEAFQKTEQTPEFLAKMNGTVDEAEAALAQSRFQDALDRYKQVMPYQPNNGRFRAGMAWALVGLNKQPMADRIWGIAVESDPAAVESLGDTLAKKGDAKGAQAVYARLTSSAPAYAASSGLSRKVQR